MSVMQRFFVLVILGLCAFVLSGCASDSYAAKGAAQGAGTGALAGAVGAANRADA